MSVVLSPHYTIHKAPVSVHEMELEIIKSGFRKQICNCSKKVQLKEWSYLQRKYITTGNKCATCDEKKNLDELKVNYIVPNVEELPVDGVMKPVLTDNQNDLVIQVIKDNDSQPNSDNLNLDDIQKSFIQYIYSLNSRVLNSEKLLEEKNEELDSIKKYLEKEEEVLESNIQEALLKQKIKNSHATVEERTAAPPVKCLLSFLRSIGDKKKERHDKSYGIIAIEQGIINHNKMADMWWKKRKECKDLKNSIDLQYKKEKELLESYIKWEALEVLPSMSWADYFLRIKKGDQKDKDTSYAIEAFKSIQSIMECYVKHYKLLKIYEKESDEFEDKEEALVLELKDEKEAHNNTKKLLEDEKEAHKDDDELWNDLYEDDNRIYESNLKRYKDKEEATNKLLEDEKKAHQITKNLLEDKEEAHKLELKKMSDEIKNMKKQFNIYNTCLMKSIEEMKEVYGPDSDHAGLFAMD